VVDVFNALAATTNGFNSIDDCSPGAISEALLKLIQGKPKAKATSILMGAASLLFLTTGKSDNNAKCQLPLHLRDKAKWAGFPVLKRRKGYIIIEREPIPRVLKADRFMPLVADLHGHPDEQRRLLREFVRFVLSDQNYVAQLWSIGHSYVQMRQFNRERSLLTPLVIFQVRGSVSASGGHEPEKRLRTIFDYLGLIAEVDYNTIDVIVSGDKLIPAQEESNGNSEDEVATDVTVEVEAEGKRKKRKKVKTRAYDFVLPFRTPGWKHRIFVQSQYYAGDSGSVSHKNVDQTSASRTNVSRHYESPLFVEYVDGAGYFSSLNGDLKSLLEMGDTHTFVQVRSAPIRIRRVLQEIGFCTPMEVGQAIARTDGSTNAVVSLLVDEGYEKIEVERCIGVSLRIGFVATESNTLQLPPERRAIVRRFLLLDTIACYGQTLDSAAEKGFLLVPGYGPFYGTKLTNVLQRAAGLAPAFAAELGDSAKLLADIQWLEEQKFVISS
jgi:hypothetical protein